MVGHLQIEWHVTKEKQNFGFLIIWNLLKYDICHSWFITFYLEYFEVSRRLRNYLTEVLESILSMIIEESIEGKQLANMKIACSRQVDIIFMRKMVCMTYFLRESFGKLINASFLLLALFSNINPPILDFLKINSRWIMNSTEEW